MYVLALLPEEGRHAKRGMRVEGAVPKDEKWRAFFGFMVREGSPASPLRPHSVLALPPPRRRRLAAAASPPPPHRLLTAHAVATMSPALGGGVYDDRDCRLDHRYTAERKEI